MSDLSPKAMILLELSVRFRAAARDGRTLEKDKLLSLILDYEWAFPDAATELDAVYGDRPTAEDVA